MLRSLHGINGHVYYIDSSLHHLCRLQELSANDLGCSLIHLSRHWIRRILNQTCWCIWKEIDTSDFIFLLRLLFSSMWLLSDCKAAYSIQNLTRYWWNWSVFARNGHLSWNFPPKYLHLVVGLLGFTIAVAGVMDLGGVITGTTTWRWIFWLK